MIKKIGLIFVVMLITIGIMIIAGCSEEKKEYTIDEPFDFSTLNNDSAEDEVGSEVSATKKPADSDLSTPVPNGTVTEPTSAPDNAPVQGGSSETPSQNTGDSGTAEVQDKTFNDIANENKVPEDVAQKMTTKALMETYMKYPMIKLLVFEADPIKAYEEWLNNDDICVNQLIERDDSVAVIIEKYKALVNKEKKEHLTDEADMDMEFEIDWIELLLLQDQVKEKATVAQQKEIRDLAIKRDENVLTNGYAVTDLYPSLAEAYKLG